jgi:DegV family protein with EDD domain
MDPIAIVTDRGCDLSPEERERHGVTVVPLIVRFGEDVILDDGGLSADEFWQKVEASHTFPQTSQPSIGMFEEAFAPLVAAGKHVLCPLITGRLSGTFNAAYAAAQRFAGKVTVVDTRSLSLGQGFQVLAAVLAARQGQAVDAIVQSLASVRERTHLIIMLDTVEFLRRGGRAGALMPWVDRIMKALRVRPLLRLEDGQLRLLGAARSVSGALHRIGDEISRLGPIEQLAVAHTRRSAEAAEFAAALAQRLGLAREDIPITEAGPALSAHAGPGVLAAAAVRKA